jgi:4-amino-4-deoxy-L-arabinose transferase-like glycosyltransferase
MSRKSYVWFFVAAVMVQLLGMLMIDLMEHDATQYATIAMQMIRDGSWLQVFWRDVSYLDKPPLVFWTSSVSYMLFGVNHFAYRLPSYLVLLLGVYSTFRLARQFYGMPESVLAALVLITSQGIFLISHDVRTDTMLMGWVTFSLWQFSEFFDRRKWPAFFWAFTGVGLAMLTKGPLGLMIPILSFGPYILLRKKWKDMIQPYYLLGLAWVVVVLSPMLVGLWQQHGFEGIGFYFWKQSFGRITGENVWRDDSGPLFFVHSFAWAFLPWTLPAIFGIYLMTVKVLRRPAANDSFILWGAILVFVAMSFATYKLPHYIFVVFPLFAIMAAMGIMGISRMNLRMWIWGQWLTLFLISSGMIFLTIVDFSVVSLFVLLASVSVITLSVRYLKSTSDWGVHRVFVFSYVVIVGANAMLHLDFYPKLLQYQSGSVAGSLVKQQGVSEENVCFFVQHSPSFDFYAQMTPPYYRTLSQLDSVLRQREKITVFTNETGYNMLTDAGYTISELKQFREFKATKLSFQFIIPDSRNRVVSKNYLVSVGNKMSKAQTVE